MAGLSGGHLPVPKPVFLGLVSVDSARWVCVGNMRSGHWSSQCCVWGSDPHWFPSLIPTEGLLDI